MNSSTKVPRQPLATLSQRLASHAATTSYETIPSAIKDAAILNMMDTLAVSWAGSDAPGCREAYEMLVDDAGKPDSTAWAYGKRLPASAAAFINGMSSAALDYDALGRDSPVHVNISVLPAALAIAEKQHASGKEFLTALVLGSDIMVRMGLSATHPHKGWSYTSAFGGFGAAAAASRLLGLDATTTAHALGIAFIQASGTQQANIEPSLSKRMLSAFAARAGVYAALLAQRGITAPSHVLEGQFGLYKLYQDGDPERLLDELGQRFESASLSIKKFPSCGCNHTALEATIGLVRKYKLRPDDVLSVRATVTPYINRIVGGPYDPSGDAQVAAQFSLRYSIACALVRGKLGLADIQEAAARDPLVSSHIGKIAVHIDSTQGSGRGPVVVELQTSTHGLLTSRVEHVPGSTESPLDDLEIDEKIQECFRLGVRPLKARQISELTSRVRAIEQITDMSTLFDDIC